MRRLLICYNPRSSHHTAVADDVLATTRQMSGWLVGRYEIKPTDFQDNVNHIAKLVNDGDLVIVAGGDGTSAMTINGILQSNKDVTLGVLGYGNFNDTANMLGLVRGKGGVMEILRRFEANDVAIAFPLEIKIDKEHWRYALNYMTIGMFAQSTEVFDDEKIRKQLQTGGKGKLFSLWQLAKWYFRKGKRQVLPAGRLNGAELPPRTTDYIALNGTVMAGLMKGEAYYLQPTGFISATAQLGKFLKLAKFMFTSMAEQVPGEVHEKDILEFDKPSEIELHAEGEYEKFSNVSTVEVGKPSRSIKVILSNKR